MPERLRLFFNESIPGGLTPTLLGQHAVCRLLTVWFWKVKVQSINNAVGNSAMRLGQGEKGKKRPGRFISGFVNLAALGINLSSRLPEQECQQSVCI